MNYNETGFRGFYHNFCVIPLTEKTIQSIEGFPGAETANGILVYGYIDKEAGLTLEVIAAAHVEGDKASFEEPSKEIRSFIRVGAIDPDDDFLYFDDEDGKLSDRYADRIDILHNYDANEQVEKTREMPFLDSCRHEHYPDDIMVFLYKEDLEPEGCWVRITGLGDHYFIGTLLNEPNQDFGYHNGETVAFFVQKTEDERFICISDMNPSAKITAEDLEDGSMLEAAVAKFNAERNEPNFLDILEILRDSYVWVPCNAIMSDADNARFQEMIKSAGDDLTKLKGLEFTAHDETRLVPDILKNGDEYFFPIFSNEEAMGEYGDHFSKVQKHMLEVIPLARNNEKKPVGIVLNAFGDSFILEDKIWDVVENMKSRIQK